MLGVARSARVGGVGVLEADTDETFLGSKRRGGEKRLKLMIDRVQGIVDGVGESGGREIDVVREGEASAPGNGQDLVLAVGVEERPGDLAFAAIG
jgi:hypothetical protein